jgi:hypothetical protein
MRTILPTVSQYEQYVELDFSSSFYRQLVPVRHMKTVQVYSSVL